MELSLGCALPTFLAFSSIVLAQREAAGIVGTVLAFAAGSAVSLIGLVLFAAGLGDARELVPFRRLQPYASGILLVVGGVYLIGFQLARLG